MAHRPEERDQRLAARERAVAANESEAARLLAEARAAHREADRGRNRARKLAARYARKLRHTLSTARAKLDADRAAIDAKVAKFTAARSQFHLTSAADHDRLRQAWSDLEARQKRLAEEWEETNSFQAEQAANLDARAHDLAAREQAEAEARAKLQGEVGALREEAASLDARIRNARQVVEELEQRRTELRAEVLAPATGTEPPPELQVALDRTADRDLAKWAAELEAREERLKQERIAVQTLFANVSAEKGTLADRRRVLAEQFAQLAAARAQWQEAERVTVAEMEQVACTLRRREAELDIRDQRIVRSDVRRREDAYELWQLRLRLEAWQAKIVAYEMRWHTERAQMEADFERREAELRRRQGILAVGDLHAKATSPAGSPEESEDAIPLALAVPEHDLPAASAELAALRDELERLAEVIMEAELPEPLETPESELPWGTEEVPMATPEPDEAEVLLFELPARAA